MAPDLEFIARMTDDWIFSHTFAAQVWFTIPVTLTLVWLITRVLVPVLLPYVGEVPALRLHDLSSLEAPATARQWMSVATSAWIGGLSHLLLDGMTHGGHSGWMVPIFPVLRELVPHFGGPVPLYDSLQCWLTIGLGIAALQMWRTIAKRRLLWQWKARAAEPQRIMPRRAGVRLVMIFSFAAVQGAFVGLSHHRSANTPNVYAALLFGAIDVTFAVVVVTAAGVRVLSGRSARRAGARAGRDQTLISA